MEGLLLGIYHLATQISPAILPLLVTPLPQTLQILRVSVLEVF